MTAKPVSSHHRQLFRLSCDLFLCLPNNQVGPATAEIVSIFQSDVGLETGGIVGPLTWKPLISLAGD